MVFIVEGKKRCVLYQDCQGVSEVYGQLLMMSIVVLAFSTIGLAVFSDGGVVKPEHTPNTDLSENICPDTNDIKIVHSGGETIDLSSIEIILSVNGLQVLPPYVPPYATSVSNFTVIDSDGTLREKDDNGTYSSNNVFRLGDCIVINTNETRDPANPTKKLDLKTTDDIDMFFVDTPSKQVIQKVALQRGNKDNSGVTESVTGSNWITPHPNGTATDTSGGWISTESVNEIGDGIFTIYYPPSENDSNPNSTAQVFDFNINATEGGVSAPIHKVILKIVYSAHKGNYNYLADISVAEPENWIRVNSDKKTSMNDFDAYEIDITPYVKSIDELEKLKARIIIITDTSEKTEKKAWIDFLGVHIE